MKKNPDLTIKNLEPQPLNRAGTSTGEFSPNDEQRRTIAEVLLAALRRQART
jgi:hypothetical protein